jgi:CxxC motif-containing protein (DUF1111 family)
MIAGKYNRAIRLGLAGLLTFTLSSGGAFAADEAPTGFDNQTNGVLSPDRFRKALEVFEHQVTVEEGLGPIFTARSCAACHGQPVSGGQSQVRHLVVGHPDPIAGFFGATVELGIGIQVSLAPLSGFLWPRSICSEVQMRLPEDGAEEPIRSSRIALNTLGAGYIEAIPDLTIIGISIDQLLSGGDIAGEVAGALAFETNPPTPEVGRFGWKSAVGSLLTFAGAAAVADLGVTNRLFPDEFIPLCDSVADPEDSPLRPIGKQDVDLLAAFMRSTKAPPRDTALAATYAALEGGIIFGDIGCATCHVPTLETAPAGTLLHGGAYEVPDAIGDKLIHPYSDFLLHDVGTGDGTVVFGTPASTANKLRTPPLWGLRMRNRIMHDGQSNTLTEAIERHGGEAIGVNAAYQALTIVEKDQLITFLKSL